MMPGKVPALLFAGWIVVSFSGALALTPPIWPSSFSVTFHEKVHNIDNTPPDEENDGAWYYDYSRQRARHDHLKGQNNTFCQGRGLNLTDPHGDCRLLYVNNTDMYVHYPGDRQCCRACGPAEGCTMMPQNNLAQATNNVNDTMNGTTCIGWILPRGRYPVNQWYMTKNGTPCFHYTIPIWNPSILLISHSYTFNLDSYHVGPIPHGHLDVPSYCNTTCPHPYVPSWIPPY
ncbi:Hypp255 [Branchiostoma lanceolatum]|uniref:Hypp255 protein n=1 Tax=Branchiostoma lanceolatum TaxID=7740 RepID=A0A8J9V8L9_BRALA|nr:Hypp255 [Branchiostoma lanceolatum]